MDIDGKTKFSNISLLSFLLSPVPKLIANDQNKEDETMAYWRIGDRGWLWKYLPMSMISTNNRVSGYTCSVERILFIS